MLNLRHTLRKPFSIPDEPIEGIAIAIHREDDEDDYGAVSDKDEAEDRDKEIVDAHLAEEDDSVNDPEDLIDVL